MINHAQSYFDEIYFLVDGRESEKNVVVVFVECYTNSNVIITNIVNIE